MSLEERLAKVEQELAELKLRLADQDPRAQWFWKVRGSMAAFPEFEEVVRLGREIRKADVFADVEEDS